jgi:hypothetical protein
VTHFERHDSHTDFHHAVAFKLFLALFLNTGLVVILVNADIEKQIPAGVGVFSGDYRSYTADWFAGVDLGRRACVLR